MVKDKVIVNDRWGSGIRFKHAGIYTPEYQPDLDFDDHYWEESRGMGYSYGYNREEDAWDYNSTQSLVLQLIDKVSRGGNFLLDMGPDEHGKIPPIMQERLLQIGEWLKINGEAIYNTMPWKESSQWSTGNREYKDRSGDMLLKITVDPDPGYAVKEVFYTYQANTNSLYAIFPKYPSGKKLVLKDNHPPAGTTISFLSTKEKLNWQQQGEDVVINLPEYDPNKIKSPYAFVLKIDNYGMFAARPVINIAYENAAVKPLISFDVANVEAVRYTTDGAEPDLNSDLYIKPFSIASTSVIKAKAYQAGGLPSTTVTATAKVYAWKNAVEAVVRPGIAYSYYQPGKNINMATAFAGGPVATGMAEAISLTPKKRADKFAFEFKGYIKIAKDGVYSFYTQSDDGSKLFIDDEEIVNNDGDHGTIEKNGKAALKKGLHTIRVIYFDSGGGNELKALMQPDKGVKAEIPATMLFH